jgi:hypothetical protein
MKSAGASRPSVGWFQRASASTPTIAWVAASNCGWYQATNSLRSSPDSMSSATRLVVTI